MIRIMALVLVISIGFLVPKVAAQSDKYSKMAAVDPYLMERNAEILPARSGAPVSISSDATILVLGRQGYVSMASATEVALGLKPIEADFWSQVLKACAALAIPKGLFPR